MAPRKTRSRQHGGRGDGDMMRNVLVDTPLQVDSSGLRQQSGELEREPRSGPTLYTAACITALAAAKSADSRLTTQALDLLEQAFAQGIDRKRAAADPDLASVHDQARFGRMVSGASQ